MGPNPAVARVRQAVRDALADLEPGALVLVACSGGADSLALAAAAGFEGARAGLRVGAITVDHGLQAGSDAHARQVAAALRELALEPVDVATVRVGRSGGVEGAARRARYDALDAAAERLGAATVLLGHTRDDQAETVLLGLARGAGTRSLSGMAPIVGRYRRPLLELDRATTRAACADAGLPVWDDPHNDDPAFSRVRVRHRVLPVLEAELGPGVGEALARTAGLCRDDADALDELAMAAWAACADDDGGLVVATLADHPAAVRRRVLRQAALAAGCPGTELFAVHIREIDTLITRWRGQQGIDLPGKVRAVRRCGVVRFEPADPGR